mmetsp:Transcript_47037/g.102364  ORF Transcript_47037/g.102364 Transcript_47037/m.102364 type:complete len:115 (-) Transcript_47037:1005-1349(-)
MNARSPSVQEAWGVSCLKCGTSMPQVLYNSGNSGLAPPQAFTEDPKIRAGLREDIDNVEGYRRLHPIWGTIEPSRCHSKVQASSRVPGVGALRLLKRLLWSSSLASPMRSSISL